ncbi:MAG: class I SAM-dependent methyltransferase [Chloroflexales bacterium]|nr:class I SAM-dependent methyltransferase [Chloroflexales bacterium]
MSIDEPSTTEIGITIVAGTLFAAVYRDYVDRLELRGDERILDYGSGAGTPARFLARRLQRGGQLTCVDISARWQGVARRRLRHAGNVAFKLGPIEALELPDQAFDGILVHFVLHDIPTAAQPAIVGQMGRVLASAGRIFIREPLRFIARDEIDRLMSQIGLVARTAAVTTIPTQGAVYEAVYSQSAVA